MLRKHCVCFQSCERGYKVLVLDSPIVSHLIQKLESKIDKLCCGVDEWY